MVCRITVATALLLSMLLPSVARTEVTMSVTSTLYSPSPGEVYHAGFSGVKEIDVTSNHEVLMTGVSGVVTVLLVADNNVEGIASGANIFTGTRTLIPDNMGVVYAQEYFWGPGQTGYTSTMVPMSGWTASAHTRATYSGVNPALTRDHIVENAFTVTF